jgi:MFS family permease
MIGFASNVWVVVAARFLHGLFNGNIVVTKAFMSDVTDARNRPKLFTYMALGWGSGCFIAPLIGGGLAKPVKTFPSLFGDSQFFEDYPYLLPFLVIIVIHICSCIFVTVMMKDAR